MQIMFKKDIPSLYLSVELLSEHRAPGRGGAEGRIGGDPNTKARGGGDGAPGGAAIGGAANGGLAPWEEGPPREGACARAAAVAAAESPTAHC
jgi:hypothetical protein